MNKRIRTTILSTALLGGTVIGAAQVGGVANAQTDDEPVPTEQPDDATDDSTDDGEGNRRRHRGMGAALEAISEVIGIDADEIRAQVRDGATLGDIAVANGADPADVVDVIVDSRLDRLATGVENGRITQEQADTRAAELEERVATHVDEGRPERADGERGPRGQRGPRGGDTGEQVEAPAEN